jgi:hypothetical protein
MLAVPTNAITAATTNVRGLFICDLAIAGPEHLPNEILEKPR